jgi:tetratricopeptide (TPR) repeat protein/CHAT domain-containing protein
VTSSENDARELFELGSAAQRAGRFHEAIKYWTQAKAFCLLNQLDAAAALCDANIGVAWFEAGDTDQAIDQYELAREQFLRLGMMKNVAQTDENIGKARAHLDQHKQAIECYERAKEVFTQLDLFEEVVNCEFAIAASLFNGALLEFKAGNLEEAVSQWLQARPIFVSIGLTQNVASCDQKLSYGLVQLGQIEQALLHYRQAKESFLRLGMEGEASDCDMIIVSILFSHASELHRFGRNTEAIDLWTETAALAALTGRERDFAGCKLNIGAVLTHQGQYEKAMANLEEAKGIFLRLKCDKEAADCEVDIGNVLGRIGKPQQAIEYYEQASGVFRSLNFPKELASASRNLGLQLLDLKRPEQAIRNLEEAKPVFANLGLQVDVASCEVGLGTAHYLLGAPARAHQHFRNATQIYRSTGFEINTASGLLNAGVTLGDVGKEQEGLELLEEAKSIFLTYDLKVHAATCDMNFAAGLCKLGHLRESIVYSERAKAVFEKSGSEAAVARCQTNIGIALGDFGKPQQAIEHFQLAKQTFSKLGLRREAADCDVNTGMALSIVGKHLEGLVLCESALVIYADLNLNIQLAMCRRGVGAMLLKYDDPNAALEYFKQAKETFQELGMQWNVADCDLAIGAALATQGQTPHILRPSLIHEALVHFDQARQFFAEHQLERDVADCDNRSGVALAAIGQPWRAIPKLERAKATYTRLDLKKEVADCDGKIGQLLTNAAKSYKGDFTRFSEEALNYLDDAITAHEQTRSSLLVAAYRGSFFEEYVDNYKRAFICCLRLGRLNQALNYLERSRARILSETIISNLAPDPEDVDEQLCDDFFRLRGRLLNLGLLPLLGTGSGVNGPANVVTSEQTGSSINRDFERVVNEIIARHPDSAFVRQLKSTEVRHLKSTDEYLNLLPDHQSCLLEFVTWSEDNRLRAFLVTRNNKLELLTFPKDSFQQLASVWHQWVGIYDGGKNFAERARTVSDVTGRLYDLIFDAEVSIDREQDSSASPGEGITVRLIDHLDEVIEQPPADGCRRMYVVPHSYLFLLPLHAAWRKETNKAGAHTHYVLEDYLITFSPSAFLLRVTRERDYVQPQRPRALVVGNPQPAASTSLPMAKLEAEEVVKALTKAGWSVDELIEHDATKSRFLHGDGRKVAGIHSGEYHHLHLAQHAGLDENGRGTYLLFSQMSDETPIDDFICYDSEITFAPLRKTSSVVAAACSTSVTHPNLSEYLGLGAAFLQAGVGTFIGTLYPISDEGSVVLVRELYRLHVQEGLSWSSALRQAQLAMATSKQSDNAEDQNGIDPSQILSNDQLTKHSPYYWGAFIACGKE